eukprot:4953851-Amphidinium_carterae.1
MTLVAILVRTVVHPSNRTHEVVRFVRAECKDGPSCGLTGNEKDAKYSMIRDLILQHLFRALNKDVRKERSTAAQIATAAHASHSDSFKRAQSLMAHVHGLMLQEQDARIAKLWSSPPLTIEGPVGDEVHQPPCRCANPLIKSCPECVCARALCCHSSAVEHDKRQDSFHSSHGLEHVEPLTSSCKLCVLWKTREAVRNLQPILIVLYI